MVQQRWWIYLSRWEKTMEELFEQICEGTQGP